MLQPSIRQSAYQKEMKEVEASSAAPANPFTADSYFYPAPYLQLPVENVARQFSDEREHRQIAINKDFTTVLEYAPGYFKYMHEGKSGRAQHSAEINKEKSKLIKTVKKIVNEMKTSSPKPMESAILIDDKTSKDDYLNIIVVSPFEGKGRAAATNATHTKSLLKSTKTKKQHATTVEHIETTTPSQPQETNVEEDLEEILKESKTFFRPSKTKVQKQQAASAIVEQIEVPAVPPSVSQPKATIEEESAESAEDLFKEPEPMSKGPFSSFFNSQKEQVVEALKQGGVIIQRLRVRNGGIAIAGPNGVATAGSGGTAIVGPGGIALTHPRSLAIAGPGARVFAVPASTDLQELALRSNARDLPQKGVLVATGPVVYYNPETQ